MKKDNLYAILWSAILLLITLALWAIDKQ